MPAKKPSFWDYRIGTWVEKYHRENPSVDSGLISDLRSYLMESKGWKDYEHVTDFLLSHDVKNKDPIFWSWMDSQMTSEQYTKSKEQEEADVERVYAEKKTLRDLLFDYGAEKEELDFHSAEFSREELDAKTKEFREKKQTILRQLDLVKELSDEGYDYANMFMKDNEREVVIKEVSERVEKPIMATVSDIEKRFNAELAKLRKATATIPTGATNKEETDRLISEFNRIASVLTGKEVIPQVQMGYQDYSVVPEARKAFLAGDRPKAARILSKGGFGQNSQESLYSTWVTERPSAGVGGAGFDVATMRRTIREEFENISRAASVSDYEVEWVQSPDDPECWDRYTLSIGVRELARKKLSAQKGISLESIDKMIEEGTLDKTELDRIASEITSDEVEEMLVKTGRVTIIKRNLEFEMRLMTLPFAWGNGYFFKLSPEGRRNSGWSSWKNLDTLCKVVEKSVREGDWSFQAIREAGVPRSFVNQCIREVRRESAGS
jgi:hypothetical protein